MAKPRMLKMAPMSAPMKMAPMMRIGDPKTPEQKAGIKRYHKDKKDRKERNVGYKPGAFYDKKGKNELTGTQRAIGGQGGFKSRRSSGPSKGGPFGFTDKIGENHYNWRDSFDLEEMTIAQRNSMQNQNKMSGRERAQAMFKANQAKGMGTAQAAQANKEAMRAKAAAPKQATPAPKGIAKVDPKQFDSRRAAPASATRKIDGAGLAAKMGAQAVPSAQRPQTSVRTRGGGVQTAPRPSGLVSRIKSRVGAIKQGVGDIARGASSLGKRVAGGVADAATGNKFDFDKRGGQKSAPKIAGSGNVGGSGARAQDALNRNPNPPQKQDALNRSKEKPGATPATNTGGMRPTNTGNARRDNFNAKVNTLKNKQKYGGTGNPITIGDKTYNPQDKGYKDAFNTVSSAVTKSQKNIGVDTSPGKSDSTSLVNNNKKKNIKNANKVTNQMNNLSKKEAEFTGEPAGKTTVGKIDFGGF